MYAVVGCSNCQALWIVDGRPETTSCPRCRTRHEFDRLKQFVRTEDREEAREVRAAMLASAQGREAAYEKLDSIAAMEAELDSAGVDDEEYLAEHGIDPEAIAAAGERNSGGSNRRRDRILDAIDALEEPTEGQVVEYASEWGVPAEAVRTVLEKLAREGTIVQGPSGYRRL
ncbi:MAG: DUF5817 domain-containing protein [Halodesulfurarchaeum sp.]|nr:DUF5817 domain-containing protein [Halodesulfurarchaeum sp.]